MSDVEPTIKLDEDAWASILVTGQTKNVYLSGSILHLIDDEGRQSYKLYLSKCLDLDDKKKKKRLQVNKKTQRVMKELTTTNKENLALAGKLQAALEEAETQKQEAEGLKIEADAMRTKAEEAQKAAEDAKDTAERELDTLQKKHQFELVGDIVNISLAVICGVGLITTGLYASAIYTGSTEVSTLGQAWSNMFGILLTNSFSIIGTIMGVKYASARSGDSEA